MAAVLEGTTESIMLVRRLAVPLPVLRQLDLGVGLEALGAHVLRPPRR